MSGTHYDNGTVFCGTEAEADPRTIHEAEVTCVACRERLRGIDDLLKHTPRKYADLSLTSWRSTGRAPGTEPWPSDEDPEEPQVDWFGGD